ncbi:MAG TPA: serine hydrolase, partial [Candidatus Saccharimonadales bacterium]|nr:serine hydrolase [Candidatus Saccharimonadales bacterium]
PIASLTKLMSAAVALDLMNPNETITVSSSALRVIPTKIGVATGEKLPLKDLLEAMLMTSANDAAQAVHDGVNAKYHENIFVRAMNEKAQSLGLTQTHFANPQGFDGNNYSSAHDLAILTQYVLTHYPLIDQIVKQDYTFIPATSEHKQYDLYNWNGLLGVYPGAFGVKIGNTDKAGYTTVVIAKRNDKIILAVLLGSPGILERDLWTANLLDDAFISAFNLPPAHITSADLEAKYATWHYWN